MTVYNFGSINVDRIYRVPHLPVAGETLAATSFDRGLGGKGANQSVAVSRAGRPVRHIGKIGPNDAILAEMVSAGVDVTHVSHDGSVTGHANIYVDDTGENQIVLFPGANHEHSLAHLKSGLANAKRGDFFMLQNETNLTREAATLARDAGLFVVYSAAPFVPELVADMLPLVDMLVVNSVEAAQVAALMKVEIGKIQVPNLLITLGAAGVVWHGKDKVTIPAFPVEPVDTTGAGDCFIGYVVAGMDEGLEIPYALRLGAAAAAIQVTRPGTAQAVPTRAEVTAFLRKS